MLKIINLKVSILVAISLINLFVQFKINSLSAKNIDNFESLNFKQPEPPRDRPKIGKGRGGGSRGNCSLFPRDPFNRQDKLTLIALIPNNGWGLTTSQSPSFWVAISYPSGSNGSNLYGEFSLEDSISDTKLDPKRTLVTLPESSGIFNIVAPHSLDIDINKRYRWYFKVYARQPDFGNKYICGIEGIVMTQPTNTIEIKTEENLMQFYIDRGIWYDAFDRSMMLYCQNLPDKQLVNYWQDLLKSDGVNLSELSQQNPICPNN